MIFSQETLLPQKTIFRKGAVFDIADEVVEFGTRGLIVHGKSLLDSGRVEEIIQHFHHSQSIETFCRSKGEPDLLEVTQVIEKGREVNAEWIAGIGGGSVLDLAKAAAGLFNAKEPPQYYQEGGKLRERGIPFIAVPTTAGTGSEATSNSVIINKKKLAKLSIRDKSFLAREVILDVDLVMNIPPSVMKYAAMDAYVQAYESFISKNSTWFSETFAYKALELINGHILPAYEYGEEIDLSSLLLGSYFAGIALHHARLGVIHGIAHPLGALYGLSHGLICSVCFIPSIKLNKEAMGEKYDLMSKILGVDLLERIETIVDFLGIVSPFKGKEIIEENKIIKETLTSGSTAANPKPIVHEDVEFLLKELF